MNGPDLVWWKHEGVKFVTTLVAYDRMLYLDDGVQGLSNAAFLALATSQLMPKPLFAGLPLISFSDLWHSPSRFHAGSLALLAYLVAEGDHVFRQVEAEFFPGLDEYGNLWDDVPVTRELFCRIFGPKVERLLARFKLQHESAPILAP